MARLAVEEIVPTATVQPIRPPTLTPEPPPEAPRIADEAPRGISAPSEPSTLDVTLAAFQGLAFALSARALLLLALVGAFTLALLAMQQPTGMRLGVLIAFAVLVVLPCIYLERNKGR